ncbi:hypothetical protein BDV95DRAFT_610471 [Massariosphaeria phaeospora]|uniref:Extracellular membrane protein CFEM domain-containing protein n=1 Tax=Massariosphaeria phaeospora TaxID=100035 RepID=A0A7C8I462_9PLEO|nr:hypothetical protein BDV95DRAFT_610471 [Massariosphaeria phaeospora]
MKLNLVVLLAVFTTSSIACKCVLTSDHSKSDYDWTKRCCEKTRPSGHVFENGDCKAESIHNTLNYFARVCREKSGYTSDCKGVNPKLHEIRAICQSGRH